jgi:hypothetical protein
MSKKGTVSGTWSGGRNMVKCKLPIIIFEEGNCHIFYCPALDLSGYGNTESEASNSFNKVLSEYFRYTMNKGTLSEDLRRHGWTLRTSLKKRATPPSLGKLLETNEDFSRIFNNHDFRKIDKEIRIPAIA